MDIVSKLKFNSNSDLFALERNKGLSSIIENVYATFDGVDIYPSIEETSANFLYLVIKNHTFIDYNKRIAVTLLVAEFNPKEKNILVDLVMKFLNNN